MQADRPFPTKLFAGVLFSDARHFDKAVVLLQNKFGGIDYVSPEFEFNVSDYYTDELGWPIYRKFVSFETLIDPGELAPIKLETNRIEAELSADGKRQVNIDPGYLDHNKVVLASAKYNGQKIYLAHGIYADATLWYEKGEFKPYPYAFPDFKSGVYTRTFLHIRARYKAKSRKTA